MHPWSGLGYAMRKPELIYTVHLEYATPTTLIDSFLISTIPPLPLSPQTPPLLPLSQLPESNHRYFQFPVVFRDSTNRKDIVVLYFLSLHSTNPTFN